MEVIIKKLTTFNSRSIQTILNQFIRKVILSSNEAKDMAADSPIAFLKLAVSSAGWSVTSRSESEHPDQPADCQ